MTLEELAALAPRTAARPVPAWAWGCFARRSITYASGQEDRASRAVRLQAQGLTAHLCVQAGRPSIRGRASLHDFTAEELLQLCAVDGGAGDAFFGSGAMTWRSRLSFEPYHRWPEPALLQRVGPALIESAPSGAYVQDWRLQPGSGGLMAGLRLMFETAADGLTRPRDGALVICGDHCLFVLDRHRPLPASAPVEQQMRQAGDRAAFANFAFDGEATYGRRGPDGFLAELSTHPLREGRPMPVAGGFGPTSILEVLRQEVGEGPDRLVRQWRIDTLVANAPIGPATTPDGSGAAWLAREAPGLLKGL